MKGIHDGAGGLLVDDKVAEALERLAIALSEKRMSAKVTLHPADQADAIEFTLGIDRNSGEPHVLHAKPATGEASHFNIEDV
jgi:hypothetical protein